MLLSVLDQAPIPEGSTGADALRNTLDFARLADALGYHRYWVAEHHGGPMLACAAPEVLVGAIATETDGIRVGSGGVLLPYYSPLKVAEVFSSLAALHPGRIDLGLCRGPGARPLTISALQRLGGETVPDDFFDQLTELVGLLAGSLPPSHPFAHLQSVLPGRPAMAQPWLLGGSRQSAISAAQLGLPYAYAHFITPGGAEIMETYRNRWRAEQGDRPGSPPRTAIGVWVICADTDGEARYLASSMMMMMLDAKGGRLIQLPPPDTAAAWLKSHPVAPTTPGRPSGAVFGSPELVRRRLQTLADEYGTEEVIVVTNTYDHHARRRSLELLASAFDLTPRAEGSVPA
ncbi:MAG: LLM class flavin-dependent oxidoreductase [Solirubrobacterales bacterium]|nr:LLM class flavin-dependent oxidoreductase [Solirubrobacterales bacterium]